MKQKAELLSMLLGILSTNLLGNMLPGKAAKVTSRGVTKAGDGTIRMG